MCTDVHKNGGNKVDATLLEDNIFLTSRIINLKGQKKIKKVTWEEFQTCFWYNLSHTLLCDACLHLSVLFGFQCSVWFWVLCVFLISPPPVLYHLQPLITGSESTINTPGCHQTITGWQQKPWNHRSPPDHAPRQEQTSSKPENLGLNSHFGHQTFLSGIIWDTIIKMLWFKMSEKMFWLLETSHVQLRCIFLTLKKKKSLNLFQSLKSFLSEMKKCFD